MINNFGIHEENVAQLNLLYNIAEEQKVPYSSIRDSLRTGDVVLVDGKYSYSFVMDILQGNRWGHAGMVVRASDIDPYNISNLPELLLWESNVLLNDGMNNRWGDNQAEKEGPMLVPLEGRLSNTYTNGEDVVIAFRQLRTNRDLFDFDRLKGFFSSVIHKTFPKSNSDVVFSVLLSRFGRCRGGVVAEGSKIELNPDSGQFVNKAIDQSNVFDNSVEVAALKPRDANTMYCTELLAATYKVLRLLEECPSDYAYVPKDFSNEGRVQFLRNASLVPETFIDITR